MSLYTKYRPKDFENLVWQDFIKNTLKNALENQKTVGAYLFCWPRWTWKTSTARLLAKSLNCLNLQNWNPCNECKNCLDFINDKLVDIIEIDAASHTWVDNIREIIEKAQFSPTQAKYKIYIIDEVHMLSKWAFNALLKILEEPPKHVKFILATTETHKVPETIISRCQRYDFKRIDKENIKKRLLFIAEKENIKIDEKSLDYIVSNSNWWLRNAISLFEQLIDENEILYEKVIEKLWISSESEINNFIEKLEKKDISIIDDFDKIIDSWKNIKLFFKEIILKIKDKIIEKIKLWENINQMINIFDIMDKTYSKTKNSFDENTTFLVWVLKIIWNAEKIGKKPESKPRKIENLKTEKIEKKEEEKIENDFSFEDLDDIFWSSEKIEEKEEKNDEKKSFEIEKFLEQIKQNWWSSALFWWAKWCDFNLLEWTLEIIPKTKMARTNIEKAESIAVMSKSLEKMWLENISIKII